MKNIFRMLLSTIFAFSILNANGVVLDNKSNEATATLQGVVWWDKDLNGIQNEVHQGIKGIRVHLYKNGVDTGEVTYTETIGVGNYKFENLQPDANYTIKIDLPKNYSDFTLLNQGDDDTKDSDIVNWVWRSDKVYLKAGETGVLDAGLVCTVCAQLHMEKYTNDILVDEQSKIPHIKVGSTVTWKYVIYNDSTKLAIDNIKVVDDKEGNITCPKTRLEPSESMECKKTGIAKEGLYSNLGSVTGTSGDKNLTDEYPSNYYGTVAKIDIEKLTNGKDSDAAPGEKLEVGSKVTWEYIVKNVGNVKLTNIEVNDDKEGAVTCPKDELDVNETMTCTKEGVVKEGEYENHAIAKATSEDGEVTSDSDGSHYIGVLACLGDYVWLDENLNGMQDSGEPGVIDVKVDLYDANGTHLATTRTDNNGKYSFCGLKDGKYKVKFEQPNTYLFTKHNVGSDVKDSDADSNGWSHTITLEAGEQDMTIDAGIYCECDDSLVHPENYKKLSAGVSLFGAGILMLIMLLATYTIRVNRVRRK